MSHADALAREPRSLTEAFAQRGAIESIRAVALNRMLSRKYDPATHSEWLSTLDLAHTYNRAADICRLRGERVYWLRESVKRLMKRMRERDSVESWSLRMRCRLLLDYRGGDRIAGPRGVLP